MEKQGFTVRFFTPAKKWMVMKSFPTETDAIVHLQRKLENDAPARFLFAVFEGGRKLMDTREYQRRVHRMQAPK